MSESTAIQSMRFNHENGTIYILSQQRDKAYAGITTVTTAGTPVSLGSQEIAELRVRAEATNSGVVYIYPVDGSKDDVPPLAAGGEMYWPVSNLSALMVDSAENGDGVHWWGAGE